MTDKFLFSGLGGGLDIVNAGLLYYAAKCDEKYLGSIRPAPLSNIDSHNEFSESGTVMVPETTINHRGRYVEPRISLVTGKGVLYFSRELNGQLDIPHLRKAIVDAKNQFGFTRMFFVDGGGDSLILTRQDASVRSQEPDPFRGGDAIALEALDGVGDACLAVVAAGLDVSPDAFKRNVDLLDSRNAYFGRVNPVTGEQEDYVLGQKWNFGGALPRYFDFAEKILALKPEDLANKKRAKSHTATVFYHALKGNYGIRRTYVPWEPEMRGERGVEVIPEYKWVYFFDASKLHGIKRELNAR